MITLDQVLLLEQKVESAVAKIQQLEAENDALRNKCSELTNALSAKSEQLSSFETDQNKIEQGIRNALDRLNSIENSVLKAAGQMQSQHVSKTVSAQPSNAVVQVQNAAISSASQKASVETIPQTQPQVQLQTPASETKTSDSDNSPKPVSFETMQPILQEEKNLQEQNSDNPAISGGEALEEENFDSEYSDEYAEDNPQDNLGFDIF